MSTIPENIKINEPLHQKEYLLDGALKIWDGTTTEVFSTISSTPNYAPTVLGSIPCMGEKEALEALASSNEAFKNGQGDWPTMKVQDRIKCMESFVSQMKETRNEVVKL